jgi:hypothetical protein
MRNLLQDADRDRLAAPLAGALPGEVFFDGRAHLALAEGVGSAFFASHANARAAELLLQPGLRAEHAALGDALLDFVMAMEEAPLPCRRAVRGALAVHRDDPRAVEVTTPFFRLTGDLMRGELRQEATALPGIALRHTGNLVEFRAGLQRNCADAEEGIAQADLRREGETLVLRHVGTVRGMGGVLRAAPVEAGTLEMRYALRGDSPVLHVAARFTASRRLGRVRLTTALDAIGEEGLAIAGGRLLSGDAWRDVAAPAEPGAVRWAEGVPVAHLALGTAPMLHIRPEDSAGVMSVTAAAVAGGALHWLVLRHGPVDLAPGQSIEAREMRLLAPGGDPFAVAAAMAGGMTGLDLDPAPPSGAALLAVATALLADARDAWPEPLAPARRAALEAFWPRQAARIEAAPDNAEEIASAAIAADTLRHAGRRPARGLQNRLVARLVALQDAAGAPMLDAQALALLAFARACTWPDAGPAPAAGAARILGAVTTTAAIPLALAGRALHPVADATGIALLARAAGAAALAEAALPEGMAVHAQEVRRRAIALLRPLVRPRADALEVQGLGGLEPGLQAAVTLALLAPEAALADGRLPEANAA